MRPSLTLILVILALLVSVVVGVMLGGGPQVWLRDPAPREGGSGNSGMEVAPPTFTPIATIAPPTATIVLPTPTTAVEAGEATPSPIAVAPTPTADGSAPPEAADPTLEATPDAPSPTEIPVEAVVEPTVAPEGAAVQVVVISPGLRLRNIPSTEGEIIVTLPNGASGVALQRDANGWIEVAVNELGTTGWLFADPQFVTVQGDVETLPMVES